MKRVLVTGAGGYIGTTLVPMLLARGYAVRALDRFFFGDHLPSHPALERVQEDARHITAAHLEGVDLVIDLVAISNDPSAELFQDATLAINRDARIRTAALAQQAGVQRYLLPSSCSVYGFRESRCAETDPTHPLTTYARANLEAEAGVLALADDDFVVTVIRQATVYGWSPRMRFDLAVNGMTFGAWKTGRLPLLRDGTQWRPLVHVADTAAAQIFLLEHADHAAVNGEIFNVGSDAGNVMLRDLAALVAQAVPREVEIEWYGDPDTRSYRVVFDKIEALGWRATHTIPQAVAELSRKLASGETDRTEQTITLEWYRLLAEWHARIQRVQMYGGILDI